MVQTTIVDDHGGLTSYVRYVCSEAAELPRYEMTFARINRHCSFYDNLC